MVTQTVNTVEVIRAGSIGFMRVGWVTKWYCPYEKRVRDDTLYALAQSVAHLEWPNVRAALGGFFSNNSRTCNLFFCNLCRLFRMMLCSLGEACYVWTGLAIATGLIGHYCRLENEEIESGRELGETAWNGRV